MPISWFNVHTKQNTFLDKYDFAFCIFFSFLFLFFKYRLKFPSIFVTYMSVTGSVKSLVNIATA